MINNFTELTQQIESGTIKIGQIVRAMKEATNIPGVEAYSERV